MPIIVVCESCGKRFRVDGKYAGKAAKCSGCGSRIIVGPATADTASPEPASTPEPSVAQEPSPATDPDGVQEPLLPPSVTAVTTSLVDRDAVTPEQQSQGMAVVASKSCPFCGEQILISAVKCRHCNELLDPGLRAAMQSAYPPQPQPQYPPQLGYPPAPIVVMPQTAVHVATHQTVVVQSPPFNHMLHFILTVLTCGGWLPIWILLWLLR